MTIKLPEVKALEKMLEVAQEHAFLWENENKEFEICYKHTRVDWSEDLCFDTLQIRQDNQKQLSFFESSGSEFDKGLHITPQELYARHIQSGEFKFKTVRDGFYNKLREKLTAHYVQSAKDAAEKRAADEINNIQKKIDTSILGQEKSLNFHKKQYSEVLTRILDAANEYKEILPIPQNSTQNYLLDFNAHKMRYILSFCMDKGNVDWNLNIDGTWGACSTNVLTDILIRHTTPEEVASKFIEKMRQVFIVYYGKKAEKDGTLDKKRMELQKRLMPA